MELVAGQAILADRKSIAKVLRHFSSLQRNMPDLTEAGNSSPLRTQKENILTTSAAILVVLREYTQEFSI